MPSPNPTQIAQKDLLTLNIFIFITSGNSSLLLLEITSLFKHQDKN